MIPKLLSNFKTMMGSKPKKIASPVIDKDPPENDTSDIIDDLGIQHYQSPIGSLQWLETLGSFDINLCVPYMSSYYLRLDKETSNTLNACMVAFIPICLMLHTFT
jgi:hypothetical protein